MKNDPVTEHAKKRRLRRTQITLLLIFVFVVPTVLFGFFKVEENAFEKKLSAQSLAIDVCGTCMEKTRSCQRDTSARLCSPFHIIQS